MGRSETTLAKDASSANDKLTGSFGKVTAARTKAENVSKEYHKAIDAEVVSTNNLNAASLQAQKAKIAETAATAKIAAAVQRLSAAKSDIEKITKKEADATLALAKAHADENSTLKDIEAAEKKVASARAQSTKATQAEQAAAIALQRAQFRAAEVALQNAEQAQKAHDKEISNQAKETAVLERELAKRDRAAQSFAAAARAREAVAGTQQLGSRTAGASTDTSAVRRAIATRQASTVPLTEKETQAVTQLTRAEDALATAQAKQDGTLASTNANIRKKAAALADTVSASERAAAAEEHYNNVVSAHGRDSLNAVQAETALNNARRDAVRANNEADSSATSLARSMHSLNIAEATTQAASDRLGSAVRKAEREFKVAGDGGNIFTRVLDGLAGKMESGGGAIKGLASAFGLLKFPLIIGGIYELISAISALVSGLFMLASAVAPAVGALAGIGPILFGAATAFGTIKAAFSGVGGVLKAYTASQNKAAAGSTKSANTQINNAEAIANAQQAVKDAQEQVGVTAQQVSDSIATAAHDVITAQQAELQSQLDLNLARKEALANINALKQAVIDASLAERGATLDLEQARLNLTQTLNDPTATRLQKEQAKLAVDNAENASRAAQKGSQDAKAASDKASNAGVEGASNVIQAKKDEADAVYNAQQAQHKYALAVSDGARQNRQAQQAVAKAIQSLADAQRQAATNTDAAATAADAYQQKLAALPPAAQKFVQTLLKVKQAWKVVQTAAANGLFPGLIDSLNMSTKLIPTVSKAFFDMGQTLGSLARNFTAMITTPRWIKSLGELSKGAQPIVRALGNTFMYLLDAFRAVSVAAIPMTQALTAGMQAWAMHIDTVANAPGAYGKMTKFFDKTVFTLHTIGQILKNVGTGFINMGKAAYKPGVSILLSIQKITKRWADWTKSLKGQNYLKKYFTDVRTELYTIDGFIGRVGRAFFKMGDNKSLAPLIQGLGQVWTALKNVFTSASGGLAHSLMQILSAIASSLNALAGHTGFLAAFVAIIADMTSALAWFIQFPGVAEIISSVFIAFAAFKALSIGAAIFQIDKLARVVSSFVKASAGVGGAKAIVAGIGGVHATQAGAAAGGPNALGRLLPVKGAGTGGAKGATGAAEKASSKVPLVVSKSGSTELGGKAEQAGAKASKGGGILSKIPIIGKIGGGGAGAAEEGLSAGSKAGLYGLAAAAVVTALVVAYKKWKWFHDNVNKLAREIGKVADTVWNKILFPAIKHVADFIESHHEGFSALMKAFGAGFKAVGKVFKDNGPAISRILNDVGTTLAFLWKIAQPILKLWAIMFKVNMALSVLAIEAMIFVLDKLAGVVAWVIENVTIPLFNLLVAALKMLVAFWVATWNIFLTVIKFIWNTIVTAVKFYWNAVSGWLVARWQAFAGMVSMLWHKIADPIIHIFAAVFQAVRAEWTSFWKYLSGAWSAVVGVAKKIWDKIASTIGASFKAVTVLVSGVWDSVKTGFTAAINFVTQNIIDVLIDGINNALNFLIGKKPLTRIPKIGGGGGGGGSKSSSHKSTPSAPKKFAKGGVLPGYTPGRDVHKFSSPTGGEIHLSGGEGILVPEATRALGGKAGINKINSTYSSRVAGGNGHYAGGGIIPAPPVPNEYKGGANPLKFFTDVARIGSANATKALLKGIEAPVKGLLGQVPNKAVRSMGVGAFNKINDAAFTFIRGHAKGSGSKSGIYSSANGKGIIPVNKRYDLMSSAIYQAQVTNKVTREMLDDLNTIITYESGWNPKAINLTDSNAKAGHPSQGLMQTIPSTFEAWRLQTLTDDITDPVANIVAGVRYAYGRYGSIENVPGVVDLKRGLPYKGYKDGGVIPSFHQGGVVPGVGPGTRSAAALTLQSLVGAPHSYAWSPALTTQIKKREAGSSLASDLTDPTISPHAIPNMRSNDPRIFSFMRYLDKNKPRNYDTMWQHEPSLLEQKNFPNPHHRSPYFPIQAFESNPSAFKKHRWPKGYNPARIIQAEVNADRTWVDSYRKHLGLAATNGLWTSDMDKPSDHALAHQLSIAHPADSPHPWAGPVTAAEMALAQQDSANAINKEWYADLQILANWGMVDLVDNLMTTGPSEGLSVARSAIKDKSVAQQLNDSIKAGKVGLTGQSADNSAQILHTIAKIASGTAAKPIGLRDVSSYLNVPDYSVVNLFDAMTDQLKALPDNLTSKFKNDVGLFRQGLFYANSGAIVPGSGNSDTVPAMLTPGEGVLKTSVMRWLGHDGFNMLNQGQVPAQMFANGGIALSPSIQAPSIHAGARSSASFVNRSRNSSGGGDTYVEINTEINNPVGENSVYSMNKELTRKAATGVFNRAATGG